MLARSFAILALAAAVVLATAAVAPVPAHAGNQSVNPFLTARLYVDPDSTAARQADAWRQTRPRDAALLRRIARQPQAEWLGGWLPDVNAYVNWYIRKKLAPAGATGFFVVYDLPQRDCSGRYSAGGASSGGDYLRWVRAIAAAVGDYPTIFVLEPDGVPDSACLPAGPRGERLRLIAAATRTLAVLPNSTVYIDAGRSDWRSARDTVSLLRQAGVQKARGFTLNVTGYARTSDELRYGHAVGRALGNKHFVVHTGRNGRGPMPKSWVRKWEDLWCNQWGRGLGPAPTTRTGDRLADAFEWILHPGNSDGPCNGGPTAGQWWPEYALGLARRAAR